MIPIVTAVAATPMILGKSNEFAEYRPMIVDRINRGIGWKWNIFDLPSAT